MRVSKQPVVTIPTLAERTGDFSGLKAMMYDPMTTVTNPVTGAPHSEPKPSFYLFQCCPMVTGRQCPGNEIKSPRGMN